MYPDFCKAGIALAGLLSSHGLDQILDLVKADEAAGGEEARQGWLDIVKRKVPSPFLGDEVRVHVDSAGETVTVNTFNRVPPEEISKKLAEEGALCLENSKICQTIHKITFAVPKGSSNVSGEHILVYHLNQKDQVNELLRCCFAELMAFASMSSGFENTEYPSAYDTLNWVAERAFSLETFEGDLSELTDVFFEMPSNLETMLTSHIDPAMRESSIAEFLKLMQQRL